MSGTDGADRLEALVARAREGDRTALEAVVRAVQDDVYGLALRMLWHPEDAEDAAQEILVRVVTGLSGFRGDSAFRTWVYRVASNHLLTTRKRRAEREELSFDEFGRQLERGLADGPAWQESDAERRLLIEEVKIGCSQGMLLCLDRPHRLAYVLGEVLGLDHREGALVMDISPAAFRKRLSRARARLERFMKARCGLLNADAACRCHRRVEAALEAGRIPAARPLFATHPTRSGRGESLFRRGTEAVEALREAAAVYRTHPDYASRADFAAAIRELLESERFAVLDGRRADEEPPGN